VYDESTKENKKQDVVKCVAWIEFFIPLNVMKAEELLKKDLNLLKPSKMEVELNVDAEIKLPRKKH